MPKEREMRTRRQAKCAIAEKQDNHITIGGVILALTLTGILPTILAESLCKAVGC